ncbi:MAG: type II toxin-antitoxin system RatA family toxin [Alphaproteobacteria bacterium]|nr:type II toxin-antitoxin system RatA family toxin [Alphaproteobacteria bacterium]
MPSFTGERILNYPIDRVFDVALDIERYPDVLAYVIEARAKDADDQSLVAALTVGARNVKIAYACKVFFEKNKSIRVIGEDKPFKHLNAHCTFTELGPATTKIEYELDCELIKPAHEMLAKLLLPFNTKLTISAFEKHLGKNTPENA